MTLLIDSDGTVNSTDSIYVAHPSASSRKSAYGQSFMLSATYTLTSVKFQICDFAAWTTGEAKAVLSSHSGVYGTSSIPDETIEESEAYDLADLPSSINLVEFTFSGNTVLEANVAYCIYLKMTVKGDYGISIGLHYTTVHSGNSFYYASGTWSSRSNYETCFSLYGNIANPTQRALKFMPIHGWESTREEYLKAEISSVGVLDTS